MEVVTNHPSHTTRKKAESSDNLNAQINSIGTLLKEMALANDGRLKSLERRIDRFEEEFKSGIEILRG